jgi:hypothetical protein
LEDPDVDGRIILKLIYRKWDGAWIGFMWLRIRRCESLLCMRDELSGSIKCGEFS